MFVDTHCHLDFPEFDRDTDAVLERAKLSGIKYIINIGSSIEGSKKSLQLAERYGCVYAAIGIHPHEADTAGEGSVSSIKELAKNKKVVAIGEIGLDYYRNYSGKDRQRSLFISLAGLGRDLGLPLVLHSRQAEADTLRIIKELMPLKGVVHCFSGDENFLQACLELGLFVSFTCNITYKKAQGLRDMLKFTPLDKLMLETDAPYLSPEGFRGKRNEPMQIKLLAEAVSLIKGVSVEEIADKTTKNAKEFFRL